MKAVEISMKEITPYTLRYTRATGLAEAGIPREELHQMTGEINWVNANEYLPVKIALTIEAYDRASEEVSKRLALI
jgi:hypothetical protein